MQARKLSIYTVIVLFAVFLIACTSSLVSYFSYREFKVNLDERVLQQLLSIKRLKRIQIEDYLKESLEKEIDYNEAEFTSVVRDKDTLLLTPSFLKLFNNTDSLPKKNGLYDLTGFTNEKEFLIVKVQEKGVNKYIYEKISVQKIQAILLERTGMGWSGESYLVGMDYKMRSRSRFYPKKKPHEIVVKTPGVFAAFEGKYGVDIYEDYRGVDVYSAFQGIAVAQMQLAILTEIDVKEIYSPLRSLERRLLFICLIIGFFAIVLALVIAYKISNPIRKMSKLIQQMAVGISDQEVHFSGATKEIVEAEEAVSKLQNSLDSAIVFAQEIGKMNLDVEIDKDFKNDALQKALIQMKFQLKDFKEKEEKQQRDSKKMLVQIQEKERGRFSKELHDGLGPMLTSLKLMVQTKEINEVDKNELKEVLDTVIDEVRNISSNLMPQSLVDFGVVQSLTTWIDKLSKVAKVSITMDNNLNILVHDIGVEVQIGMFRVIQELINNTIKHAEASKILLDLSNSEERIFISYYDNGKGFDKNIPTLGSGILNIKERVEILGGEVNFQSSEKGTFVEIILPIKIEE